MEKDLKCFLLHHNNAYLRVGPFKFELKHKSPEIALIHDFASPSEIENIKKKARGKMKSKFHLCHHNFKNCFNLYFFHCFTLFLKITGTPYVEPHAKQKEFSKLRTSKVMYMNEKLVPEAMILSKKIELATRFKLYHEKYASENFQIMNYGIGGKISGHVDTGGEIIMESTWKKIEKGNKFGNYCNLSNLQLYLSRKSIL